MNTEAKKQELAELKAKIQQLEADVSATSDADDSTWPPQQFYGAYYAMTGAVLGVFGAMISLLVNVIAAPIAGKAPLELVRVYLTFPIGARALELSSESNGLALAMGCCLYIGTGMLIGIPIYLSIVRFSGPKATLGRRLLVASLSSLAIWAINFYGILSWLQPLLFGGNWITDPSIMPAWVAAGTHLVFGWTLALLYPWGQFTAYRPPTARNVTPTL